VCPSLQDHPKDAEFLNTPIRFYFELETLFATGFVQMSIPHRAIWMRTYLGKN
jgi:hypothetical protein